MAKERLYRPDLEKIEARRLQLGLSKRQLGIKMGRADGAIFRHWAKGKRAYRKTMIALARALQFSDWRELWLDFVPEPSVQANNSESFRFSRLALRTLLEPTAPRSIVGPSVPDFLSQIRDQFPDETIRFSNAAIDEALQELTRSHLLVYNDDGTYSRPYSTASARQESIVYRCATEVGLMQVARGSARYPKLVAIQEDLLARLAHYDKIARGLGLAAEKAAAEIVPLDDGFHKNWAFGACPLMTTSHEYSLKNIDESTNRFVSALQLCKTRGISLSPALPSLSTLVRNYYPQLRSIMDAFKNLPDNPTRADMARVAELLEKHAREGFDIASGVERIVNEYPRCSGSDGNT